MHTCRYARPVLAAPTRRPAPRVRRPLCALLALLLGACAPDAPRTDPGVPAAAREGEPGAAEGGAQGGRPTDPWERARRQGADFRAIGQEPGWVFEVYPQDSLRLLADYGELEIIAPWVAPARDEAGVTTWTARADGHRLFVEVVDIPCTDVMSGDSFPQAVTVLLDDRELHGCGRPLRE